MSDRGDRCFACGNDRWGGLFRIRLVDDADGEEIAVDICEG